MILNEARPNTLDLVGTDRRPDAATTNRHAAVNLSRRHRLRERDDKVGIIVVRLRSVRTEIYNLITGCAYLDKQSLFQIEPAMIGSDANTHIDLCFRLATIEDRVVPASRGSNVLDRSRPPAIRVVFKDRGSGFQ